MTTKQEKNIYQPKTERFSFIQSGNAGISLKDLESQTTRTRSAATLELINNYYAIVSDPGEEAPLSGVNSCFAVRLALFLIDDLTKNRYRLSGKGNFSKVFYRHCIQEAGLRGLLSEINDIKLFIIHVKQCLHILMAAGILNRGAYAVINGSLVSEKNIFQRLFSAFWNQVKWEDIFPSDPDSARELKANKNILKDLLLRHQGSPRLDAVANDFFNMTGFGRSNDMFLISFLDFYVFTWFKHFNLITYSAGSDCIPVAITVTDTGRKFLNSIQ